MLNDTQIQQAHNQFQKDGKPVLVRPFDDKEAENPNNWRYYIEGKNGIAALIPTMFCSIEIFNQETHPDTKILYLSMDDIYKKILPIVTKFAREQKELNNLIDLPTPYDPIQIRIVGKTMIREIIEYSRNPKGNGLAIGIFRYEEFESKEFADYKKVVEWQGQVNCKLENGTYGMGRSSELFAKLEDNIEQIEDGKGIRKLMRLDNNDLQSEHGNQIMIYLGWYMMICRYINSLQPKVYKGKSKIKKKLADIEMSEFKKAQDYYKKKFGIMQSGMTKTIATGTGTKHSHNYPVRGHWRRLEDNKITWVNPHRRGPGEELHSESAISKETLKMVIKNNFYKTQELLRIKLQEWFPRRMWRKVMDYFNDHIILLRK